MLNRRRIITMHETIEFNNLLLQGNFLDLKENCSPRTTKKEKKSRKSSSGNTK